MSLISHLRVRDVLGVTFKEEDVVHQKIPAMRVRVIAMGQEMVEEMMDTWDAKENSFVGAIIARNLAIIIMRRMIVANVHHHYLVHNPASHLAGVHGHPGETVIQISVAVKHPGRENVPAPAADTRSRGRRGDATRWPVIRSSWHC